MKTFKHIKNNQKQLKHLKTLKAISKH